MAAQRAHCLILRQVWLQQFCAALPGEPVYWRTAEKLPPVPVLIRARRRNRGCSVNPKPFSRRAGLTGPVLAESGLITDHHMAAVAWTPAFIPLRTGLPCDDASPAAGCTGSPLKWHGSRAAHMGWRRRLTVAHDVSRLPGPARPWQLLWLWWSGPGVPDLSVIWRAYIRRFDEEQTFRFLKQVLNWTLPRVRQPEQADRWTWLVLAAYTQLRLAAACVQEQCLPSRAPPTDARALALSGPPRLFRTLAARRHTSKRAKTLRALAWTAQRPSVHASAAPSRGQDDATRVPTSQKEAPNACNGGRAKRLASSADQLCSISHGSRPCCCVCSWLKRKVRAAAS